MVILSLPSGRVFDAAVRSFFALVATLLSALPGVELRVPDQEVVPEIVLESVAGPNTSSAGGGRVVRASATVTATALVSATATVIRADGTLA